MIRYLFIILAAVAFQTKSIAQPPTKVRALFLGNSYVSVNNLPLLIKNVASSVGDTLIYNDNSPGGYTFNNHLNNQVSLDMMADPQWDYVIIQQQSVMGAAVCNEPSIIALNSFEPSNIQSVQDLKIPIDQEGAIPMLYMTWGRKNGEPSLCAQFPKAGYYCTYQGMDSLLQHNYMQMGGPNMWSNEQLPVAAVAAVWRYVRTNHPDIELYDTDESHPSMAGSYLAACTFYNMLFRKSPIGITYNPGLSSTVASNIRLAVNQIIHNNLKKWNVGYYDPAPDFMVSAYDAATQKVSFKNESNKLFFLSNYYYQIFNRYKYRWSFGDGSFSDEVNPTHIFNAPGVYTVKLFATYKNGSFKDSLSRLVRIGGPLLSVSAIAKNYTETALTQNDSLHFPSVMVGDTVFRTFHVYNQGNLPLTINQVLLSNNISWSYLLDSTTLNPGGKATLTIRFHAALGGLSTSLLSLVTNDNYTGNFTLRLFGNGIGQNRSYEVHKNKTLLPNEAVINYGNPSAGQEIETMLELKNTGNMPLKINSMYLTGDTAAFSVVGRPQTLNTKNSLSIPVLFRISDTLSRTAFLNISTNHPAQPLYRIKLSAWQKSTTGLSEIIEEKFYVYPNPTKDELNVVLSSERIVEYKISDLQGRILAEKQVSAIHILTINPLPFGPGIYLMEVTSETGKNYKGWVYKQND
jgi:PKD repeat protein